MLLSVSIDDILIFPNSQMQIDKFDVRFPLSLLTEVSDYIEKFLVM